MNGYMFFANENREKVKAENPKLKATEIVTQLGAQWKEMSAKDKEVFSRLFRISSSELFRLIVLFFVCELSSFSL
jgi:hypothetical protein